MQDENRNIRIKQPLIPIRIARIIGIAFLVLCFSLPSSGQDNYLLDSIFQVNFFAPNFSIQSNEKYFYNDEDQLIRINAETHFTLISYYNRQIVTDKYFNDPDFQFLYNRTITTLNKDGYEILVVEQTMENNNWIPIRMDSTIRDSKNNILKEYEFKTTNSQSSEPLSLTSVRIQKYEDNNLIEQTVQHYDLLSGDEGYLTTYIYEYDNSDHLIFYRQEHALDNTISHSTTKNYSYKDGLLDYESEEIVQFGVTTKNKKYYHYDYPYIKIRTAVVSDNFEVINWSEEHRHSASTFFEYDSTQIYSYFGNDTMLLSENSNIEKANLSRDSIEIQQFSKHFGFNSGNLSHFNFQRLFYRRSQYSDPKKDLESIFIFPNPNNVVSNIFINTPTTAYNKLVIFNGNGQLIFEKSVPYSDQIIIPNPINVPGIYFIRVQLDDQAISNWQKLIVQ